MASTSPRRLSAVLSRLSNSSGSPRTAAAAAGTVSPTSASGSPRLSSAESSPRAVAFAFAPTTTTPSPSLTKAKKPHVHQVEFLYGEVFACVLCGRHWDECPHIEVFGGAAEHHRFKCVACKQTCEAQLQAEFGAAYTAVLRNLEKLCFKRDAS